jgi:hypothetical protein
MPFVSSLFQLGKLLSVKSKVKHRKWRLIKFKERYKVLRYMSIMHLSDPAYKANEG